MSEEEDDEEREREMQLESELAALQKEREEILNGLGFRCLCLEIGGVRALIRFVFVCFVEWFLLSR